MKGWVFQTQLLVHKENIIWVRIGKYRREKVWIVPKQGVYRIEMVACEQWVPAFERMLRLYISLMDETGSHQQHKM